MFSANGYPSENIGRNSLVLTTKKCSCWNQLTALARKLSHKMGRAVQEVLRDNVWCNVDNRPIRNSFTNYCNR